MNTISAKEAKELTLKNIKENILDSILHQVRKAAENGQFAVTVREDNINLDDLKYTTGVLMDLGYNVKSGLKPYSGSLKVYAEFKISWYD